MSAVPGSDADEQPMMIDDEGDEEQAKPATPLVWRPEVHPLGEGEELDYDRSAYDFIHSVQLEWPSLSFDILTDSLGFMRSTFPHTVSLVTGSQAPISNDNTLTLMRISRLTACVGQDDDDDDDMMIGADEDEEEQDNAATEISVVSRSIQHPGGINRLRVMPQNNAFIATWADTGVVHIWNAQKSLRELEGNSKAPKAHTKPMSSFRGHSSEGFAMDWSSAVEGALLTGDCDKGHIFLWSMQRAGASRVWNTSKDALTGHTGSVEDIQWSPSEAPFFASCSVDRTVKLWDVRAPGGAKASVVAHDSDVNVMSWNRKLPHLIATGGDDCKMRIWDLRKFSEPCFDFAYHSGPITSIEWCPDEDSMLACCSEDDSLTVWDLSITRDADEVVDDQYLASVPEQMLFLHRGHHEVKELHWHKQITGAIVTTSLDGLNLFKPFNL